MIKEFQNLKKQLVQSLKETHQQKELLQNTRTQFETEKVEMFKKLINALSVLDKQIALANKLPNIDDRANKLLLEIYEKHYSDIEGVLTDAGVIIHSYNPLDTFNSSVSSTSRHSSKSMVLKRYLYQNVPLN